jgi:prophage regulatory protein
MAILRLPAVMAETGYRSHASIYTRVRGGLFPKPVAIGAHSVGWPSEEIHAINAARIAGKTDDDIRGLVTRLHDRRAEMATA